MSAGSCTRIGHNNFLFSRAFVTVTRTNLNPHGALAILVRPSGARWRMAAPATRSVVGRLTPREDYQALSLIRARTSSVHWGALRMPVSSNPEIVK
ncbi:MAG TPA: hypothetical protein DF863_04475 [Gammaproteobacteria bacterium]|nr:hypothetical protein [Acidiferrobacteraceae bacterium]HCV20707.1 hypothetical protein [Gammaproteobacteria bacterium]